MDGKTIFKQLKAILLPMAKSLDVTKDTSEQYDLYTSHTMKNGKPLWFGGVRIQKNYVSYYLMPVYANPALLTGISPELKKRMQGKSCFNFKEFDQALFAELKQLSQSALQDYVTQGFVSKR